MNDAVGEQQIMEPVRSASTFESAADHAYVWLKERILTGELPASRAISQVKIAKQLDISRTPLREALRRLSAEGLVVSDFNRRVRVSALDLDDFDEIYAMRLALEPLAIRRTIPNLTAAQRDGLKRDVDEMGSAVDAGNLKTFRAHHAAFHLGLVQGTGPRLRNQFSELWDHSERYRASYLRVHEDETEIVRERFAIADAEHRDILDAALEGDADKCGSLLLAHLQRTIEGVHALVHPMRTSIVDTLLSSVTRDA